MQLPSPDGSCQKTYMLSRSRLKKKCHEPELVRLLKKIRNGSPLGFNGRDFFVHLYVLKRERPDMDVIRLYLPPPTRRVECAPSISDYIIICTLRRGSEGTS